MGALVAVGIRLNARRAQARELRQPRLARVVRGRGVGHPYRHRRVWERRAPRPADRGRQARGGRAGTPGRTPARRTERGPPRRREHWLSVHRTGAAFGGRRARGERDHWMQEGLPATTGRPPPADGRAVALLLAAPERAG